MVIGDSHVRRLAEFRDVLDSKVWNATIDFLHQGGARLDFAIDNAHRAANYDITVVMLGGNDIGRGSSAAAVAEKTQVAVDALVQQGSKSVIVMSIWPRNDQSFNRKAAAVSQILDARYHYERNVNFWVWDRRQPMATYDGVHLLQRGYRRAARYLVAPIVWTIRHHEH